MARMQVPLEIRLALHDNLIAYAWALDRADADGVAATFTADGSITGFAGQKFSDREGVKEFARWAFSQPGFKGKQHHVQPMRIEPDGDGWKMTSYWFSVAWDAGRPPTPLQMGYYQDTFAQEDGEWLFKEKLILRWDNQNAPMVGPST